MPMTTPRTVLVTGGNRGIGYAIAEEFVAQGHRVAVTARSGEGPAGSLTVRADVTDAASVDAAFTRSRQKLGPVEVVVANAGITRDTLLLRMSEDDFTEVDRHQPQRRVPRRQARVEGDAEGHASAASSWSRASSACSARAGQVNYSASKSGLVGMARSLTRELGARGITANVVAPGFIETDMTAELPEAAAGRVQEVDPRRAVRDARRGRQGDRLARERRRRVHLRRGHPRRRRPRAWGTDPAATLTAQRSAAQAQQRQDLTRSRSSMSTSASSRTGALASKPTDEAGDAPSSGGRSRRRRPRRSAQRDARHPPPTRAARRPSPRRR